MTFGTQTGQESATALVQVLGKETTIGRVFPRGSLSKLF